MFSGGWHPLNANAIHQSIQPGISRAYHGENGKVVRTTVKEVRASPGSRGMAATGIAVTAFEKGVAEQTSSFFHAVATDEVALFWYESGPASRTRGVVR